MSYEQQYVKSSKLFQRNVGIKIYNKLQIQINISFIQIMFIASKLRNLNRKFSTVHLYHEKVEALTDSHTKPNVIIIPGVLGNARFYKHLITNPALSKDFNGYVLDLRDHGNSPWTNQFSIQILAADIRNWIKLQNFSKQVTIVGHSLGGRVLICLTKQYPQLQNLVNHSIIVDAAAHNYKQFEAQKTIEMLQQVAKIDPKISEEEIRAAINLISKNPIQQSQLLLNFDFQKKKFQFNVELIQKNYMNILSFQVLQPTKWTSQISIIKALKSKYLSDESKKLFRKIYSNIRQIVDVESGHNVHLQKPYQIIRIINKK